MPKFIAPAASALESLGHLPPQEPSSTLPKPKRAPRKPKAIPEAAKEIADVLAIAPELKGKRMPKIVKSVEKSLVKNTEMGEKMKKVRAAKSPKAAKAPKAAKSPKVVSVESPASEKKELHKEHMDKISDAKKALEIEKRRLQKNKEDAKETKKVIKEITAELSAMKKAHKEELAKA